ncbi:hypothetical protein [Mesorhizobium sp.]|uniref:hypothetical protein n=1 Tax=Mesorhizobium sp. TaxID=1871066 RepID=UPI00257FF056|nr:hypothetical protein [Mesorhizobium sp.]
MARAGRFDHIDARACFVGKRPDCGGTDKGAGIGLDGGYRPALARQGIGEDAIAGAKVLRIASNSALS